MSNVDTVNAWATQFADAVAKMNSDTATVQELADRIHEFRDTLKTVVERDLFNLVAFDNFMVDTEVQRKRRMSGEFDGVLGGSGLFKESK